MYEQSFDLVPRNKVFNIGQFIGEQTDSLAEVVIVLDDLFMSYPNVSYKIRFNIPFYDYGTWICYINPLKNKEALELVFLKGKILQETFPFLDDKGRKMVAGIEVMEITDELLERIIMVWEEAISL